MTVVSLLLSKLKACNDLSDVAHLLGVKPATLSFVLYTIPVHERYTKFNIPKKKGGHRTIMAPNPRLKMVQRRLADLLLDIQFEQESFKTKKQCILAHGFKKELSIVTNAQNHRNRRYVFNVDLKDFFPTLNFGRVRGFFIHNEVFKLNPDVATVIAQLACHNNQLPQGSPCSPVISNLLGHILDIHLNRLAKKWRCTYTRYADDLTFSTNESKFPAAIGQIVTGTTNRWVAGNDLLATVYKSGYQLNPSKAHLAGSIPSKTTVAAAA
jgi:hypothetical protein